jgi:isopenicillin N synthase-like dioxygenase
MSDALIPLVDFNDYRAGGDRRAQFVATLGRGLEATGFVKVTGHGVPADLLERAYAVAAETFALPADTKRQYENPAISRQRGYTSFGVERAKDRDVGDLKEFWHVGAELADDHVLTVSGDVPPNHYPTELPAFRNTFQPLFTALEDFGKELLVAIGDHLEMPESYFRDMVEDGNSVLRIIHYPDNPASIPGAVRAAQHEDINLLTVLPVSTRPGLQLLTRDGEWIAVDAAPGVMVCDTGDMMQVLTNGRIPATTHRVVNPDKSDGGRFSMPFFLHPHPDHVLTPMGPGGEAPISSRDFLLQRLRDNGVG